MATIRISDAEAIRDFPSLLARARAGTEIVIDDESSPGVTLRVASEKPTRMLSESLRLAREHSSKATLDNTFGQDLEVIINSHSEPIHGIDAGH